MNKKPEKHWDILTTPAEGSTCDILKTNTRDVKERTTEGETHTAHLFAGPKHEPAQFGKDRGVAWPNWHTCLCGKKKTQHSFVWASHFFFSCSLPQHFSSNSTFSRHSLPPFQSCSLHTHHPVSNYTLSLLLSAFHPLPWWLQRHKISQWRFGAQRRKTMICTSWTPGCLLLFF